jgi:mannobiose 2-epimerase
LNESFRIATLLMMQPASNHHRGFAIHSSRFIIALVLTTFSPGFRGLAAEFATEAAAYSTRLSEKILPYWYDTTPDRSHGGYLLADDGRGRRVAREKQLVGQARLIWTFSHVHRKGFSTPARNYLQAAETGYRFLVDHFLDREHGGYFWRTDLEGKVMTDRKILYGEAFAIYALVEYHRASGESEPLRQAMDLYRLLQSRAHDERAPGWFEHFTRDWQPIMDPKSNAEVEVAGYKSANAHLHLMEALAELFDATGDPSVKVSLAEALEVNATYFYPKAAGRSAFHRKPDWSEVTDPKSAGLSYGHNVEFAWLMIRSEQVLQHDPSWAHFEAHLDHALKFGADNKLGGLYNRGIDDQPATQTDKVWWVQAEWLAALSDGLHHKSRPDYEKALRQTLDFLDRYQADPEDGIWRDTVTASGESKSPAKAHSWKANYHDVRAIVKFIETFAPQSLPKTK